VSYLTDFEPEEVKKIGKNKIHFSKNLLEIINKLINTLSHLEEQGDSKSWLNNSKIYRILEVCICEFYLER